MLAKARAGDLDAQFHLYSAIEYCRDNYREYFDHGRQRRSLDEALRRAATRPGFDADEIRQVHGRCQKLMESTDNELGEGEQWLQKAALGGHPRAQVHLATELMTHSGNLPAEEARKSQEDARRLVRDALRSRDPAVIWDVGPMAMLGNPGDQPDMEVMAWWLAACDRGLDCGASSDRARQMCRFAANCQPYESVGDLMLRSVPDYAAVKDRARQINALIDAGDPQALGFGAATSGQ
jgi:TPR repeat protein